METPDGQFHTQRLKVPNGQVSYLLHTSKASVHVHASHATHERGESVHAFNTRAKRVCTYMHHTGEAKVYTNTEPDIRVYAHTNTRYADELVYTNTKPYTCKRVTSFREDVHAKHDTQINVLCVCVPYPTQLPLQMRLVYRRMNRSFGRPLGSSPPVRSLNKSRLHCIARHC